MNLKFCKEEPVSGFRALLPSASRWRRWRYYFCDSNPKDWGRLKEKGLQLLEGAYLGVFDDKLMNSILRQAPNVKYARLSNGASFMSSDLDWHSFTSIKYAGLPQNLNWRKTVGSLTCAEIVMLRVEDNNTRIENPHGPVCRKKSVRTLILNFTQDEWTPWEVLTCIVALGLEHLIIRLNSMRSARRNFLERYWSGY
jgi:hypothetical protein